MAKILQSGLLDTKQDYTVLLKGLFFNPSEINARVHEADLWVRANNQKLDKNTIYEIPSIGEIELFYADVYRDRKLSDIDKKEIGSLVNKFFDVFKKRLTRENLYTNK